MSRRLIVAAGLMLLPLAACDSGTHAPAAADTETATAAVAPDATLAVQNAALRLSTSESAPSAAYFTLTGGADATSLTGVSSPDVGRVEMHESKMEGGLMTMAAVEKIDVPAGGTAELRPGGLHLMLFDLTPAARAAGKVKLVLTFANGQTLETEATAAALAAMQTATAPVTGGEGAEHGGH